MKLNLYEMRKDTYLRPHIYNLSILQRSVKQYEIVNTIFVHLQGWVWALNLTYARKMPWM